MKPRILDTATLREVLAQCWQSFREAEFEMEKIAEEKGMPLRDIFARGAVSVLEKVCKEEVP